MTDALLIKILQEFFKTIAFLGGPILVSVIVVGLLFQVIQTVTQMKDMALTFVPKAATVGLILVFAAPWYIQVIRNFTQSMFDLVRQGAAM